MAGFNRKAIKKLAAKQTSGQDAYKQIFFHSAISLCAALLLLGLDYMLQQQIGYTGGLSGMGTRSILETVRTVAQYANLLLLPFWEMGIFYWAICRARGQHTSIRTFAEGFRRFGPVFRLKFLQGIVVFSIFFLVIVISSILFAFTPLALPMVEFMLPYMESPDAMTLLMADPELINQLIAFLWPVYLIFAVLLIPALMPLYYRFRMAEYVILDEPRTGAITALIQSFRLTKKQFGSLLKLDLSYWWYLLLQLLPTGILYLDLLFPAGVAGLDPTTLLMLLYIGCYVSQLVIYTAFRGRVETAYALVYNARKADTPMWKPPVLNLQQENRI